jgi:D-xylose transport system permease protein
VPALRSSEVRIPSAPPGSPRKASDGGAVSRNSGGSRGTLSLDAIAAAVIGGASLFGGRGRAMGVLLGAVLVASVGNGLDLLGLSGNFKSIATGLVLLSAVCLDMVLRRGRGY